MTRSPQYFGFFVVTEPATSHVAPLAGELAKAFSLKATPLLYGDGVKSITATVIATDPEGLGHRHKVKAPKFSGGVRTIKAHGLTAVIEDSLDVALRPDFAALAGARSSSEVAGAIAPCLPSLRATLCKLWLQRFDKDKFFSDLEQFLKNWAKGH